MGFHKNYYNDLICACSDDPDEQAAAEARIPQLKLTYDLATDTEQLLRLTPRDGHVPPCPQSADVRTQPAPGPAASGSRAVHSAADLAAAA